MATKHARGKDGINRDKTGRGRSGDGTSGGNMGAGKSGTEDLGSEKPTTDPTFGSHKPTRSHKKK